ncbi:MAG: CAP domain-containing protein [Kofleriaceae bacterium]
MRRTSTPARCPSIASTFAVAALATCLGCRPQAAPAAAPTRVVVAPPPPAPAEPPLRVTIAAKTLTAALKLDVDEHLPELRLDPSLAKVAEAAAWSLARDEVISEAAVRNAMINTLRSGVTPHLLTAWLRGAPARSTGGLRAVTAGELEQLARALRPALLALASEVSLETFAVSVRGGPGGVVAALAALEPPRLPLTIERRGARAIVTAPWGEDAAPAAFLTTSGDSWRVHVALDSGKVQVDVPCAHDHGDLEVSAQLGLFASVVDVCNPSEPRWSGPTSADGPLATTLVEMEQRSFELLNRERVVHALPPIEWDDTAFEMARAHSRDMEVNRFVEHVGSDGATVEQRLARVQLPAQRTFENVGRAHGPAQMHWGFVTSPGHRENLLAPTARRGAVAAARDPETAEVYFTQVLYEPLTQRPMRRLVATPRAPGTPLRRAPAR